MRGMRRWIPFLSDAPKVAVVRLTGVISAGGRSGGGLSDASVAPILERAFKRGKPKAVALLINSPGGSPVQSSLIGQRIRALAEQHEIPVMAFVEDVAASGGYWIAAAADEIWVDPTSIVGSIGVISASFGFQGLLERQGIERRVHTAGTSKSFLDPFQPERAEDVARLKAIQSEMHEVFIDHVRRRRGAKLADDQRLFTGEFWVGQKAVELGLADGVGRLETEMRKRFGETARFLRYDRRRSPLQRLGLAAMDHAVEAVEERALYARFGL